MLRVAIVEECQIYLADGGQFGRRQEKYFSLF